MEEYITRAEFEHQIAQLREEMNQRHTEEMKAINVNVGSKDVLDQLQAIEQKQNKVSTDVEELKLDSKAYTGDAAIFKNKVEGIESDVSTIKSDVGTLKTDVSTLKTDMEEVKTVQKGHSKFFEAHGKRLDQMATKDDIAEIKGLLQQLLKQQEKP